MNAKFGDIASSPFKTWGSKVLIVEYISFHVRWYNDPPKVRPAKAFAAEASEWQKFAHEMKLLMLQSTKLLGMRVRITVRHVVHK